MNNCELCTQEDGREECLTPQMAGCLCFTEKECFPYLDLFCYSSRHRILERLCLEYILEFNVITELQIPNYICRVGQLRMPKIATLRISNSIHYV